MKVNVPHNIYRLQKANKKGPVIEICRIIDLDDFVDLVWRNRKRAMTRISPSGEKIVTNREEFKAECIKFGNSGFVRRRKTVFLWISRDPDIIDLITTLGHEYGHLMCPFFEDAENEEKKAGRYGDAATFAAQMLTTFLKEMESDGVNKFQRREESPDRDDPEARSIRSFLLLAPTTGRVEGKGADEDVIQG